MFGGLATELWVVKKGVEADSFFGRQGFLFKLDKGTGEVRIDDERSNELTNAIAGNENCIRSYLTDGTILTLHPNIFRDSLRSWQIEYYHWTGFNLYCQLLDSETGSVAMGGGGGEGFGFRCSDDFSVCTSSKSHTFGNPQLVEGGYAEVLDVECWGFVT